MEEDTGKSSHLGGSGRISTSSASLIDYNRSGVPLVEIVSAPDIRTPDQAREYVSELRSILVTVGASDGKMEEGSLRVDANVSVRPRGSGELRTRCEIKNLNSLRSLGRAIAHEANRHIALYERGESPTQQTRFWDENNQVTGALRTKEEANDYRYFPEPDLVPLAPGDSWIQAIRESLPELPQQRRAWVVGLCAESSTNDRIETAISDDLYPFLVATLKAGLSPLRVVARTSNELAAELPLPEFFTTDRFVEICTLEERGDLTSTQVKTLLAEATHVDTSLEELIDQLGLGVLSSDGLEPIVRTVIGESGAEWKRFVEGEHQLRGFLVGKTMKASKGKADGKIVGDLLDRLASERFGL
jgi:aspartyl-tRNA(Asn)/glutamyl-tRNA(Gln) amidotransferase subunit B